MDFLRPVRAFDGYQQRRKGLAIPAAVFKKFADDQAGNLAALIAYYAFFSLFPLLLVLTTVLGFVLHGNPSAQAAVEQSGVGASSRSSARRSSSMLSTARSWRCDRPGHIAAGRHGSDRSHAERV